MRRDLTDHPAESEGGIIRSHRALRVMRGGTLITCWWRVATGRPHKAPPQAHRHQRPRSPFRSSGATGPGPVNGRDLSRASLCRPPTPYWKPAIEPTLAPPRPLVVSRAELRTQRDALERGLATFEAARETAALEAACTRNEIISLLLQDDCPLSNPPDFSTPETLRNLTEWLMYGGPADGKFVYDRRAPASRRCSVSRIMHPSSCTSMPSIGSSRCPATRGKSRRRSGASRNTSDRSPGTGRSSSPDHVATAYALEFSLRGERSPERMAGFAAEFWRGSVRT